MVTYHSATVKRGRIVISDLKFPDGTQIQVSVLGRVQELTLSAKNALVLDQSLREAARGEVIGGEEILAGLRRSTARHRLHAKRGDRRAPGTTVVAGKPRTRTKQARSRPR